VLISFARLPNDIMSLQDICFCANSLLLIRLNSLKTLSATFYHETEIAFELIDVEVSEQTFQKSFLINQLKRF
jgi:hypothetical protein